jgi:hypothetical protein
MFPVYLVTSDDTWDVMFGMDTYDVAAALGPQKVFIEKRLRRRKTETYHNVLQGPWLAERGVLSRKKQAGKCAHTV